MKEISTYKIISKIRYNALKSFFDKIKDYHYVVIKGEPLSVYAYNEEGKRYSNDIDILIDSKYLNDIKPILLDEFDNEIFQRRKDYILSLRYSHQLPSLHKYYKNMDIIVDINFSILWGESNINIDIDEFISDSVQMDIYNYKVRTLSPIKMFIQVCLHTYKDMNSIYMIYQRRSINTNSLKDVYRLLINNLNEIKLNKLYKLCCDYGIHTYIYYVLYYVGKVYNDDSLQKYINRFEDGEGINLLDKYGLSFDEQKTWKIDFHKRIECDDLFIEIQDDLNERDINKIKINSLIF